jgi:hypothetical protein
MKSGKLVDIKNQQKDKEKERVLILPTDVIDNSDVIELGLEMTNSETEMFLGRNSRCVSVDTTLSAPLGRSEKRVFKGKGDLVKFRCSIYEKKLLKVKAARCGLTLSEYFRRVALEQDITERFTDEHIQLYKMLIKYHNNFKSIGNMFKKRDPKLMEAVHELANEIKDHLKKFQE